jgi:cyclic pyranopterin phosphate synthase
MAKALTHFNEEGRARMVDVGEKNSTQRIAIATGQVYLQPSTMRLIKDGDISGSSSRRNYGCKKNI